MKSIRGGSGLGDSIYLASVVRHLLGKGEPLLVRSDWPAVFSQLPVQVEPFTRAGIDVLGHYSSRKHLLGSTQFEDLCACAGITEPVDLRLDWKPSNLALIDRIRSPGKKVVVTMLPRSPMGRSDGFGAELLPNCKVIQTYIDSLGDATVVQVGAGQPLFAFRGIDVDLANQTTVSDLLDVASQADGFLGYVSFLVSLAESFDKPAMFVWSKRGLRAGSAYVRRITPQKVLHLESSRYVIDEEFDAPQPFL